MSSRAESVLLAKSSRPGVDCVSVCIPVAPLGIQWWHVRYGLGESLPPPPLRIALLPSLGHDEAAPALRTLCACARSRRFCSALPCSCMDRGIAAIASMFEVTWCGAAAGCPSIPAAGEPAIGRLCIALSPWLAVARPRRSRPGASHLVCACTVSPILQRTPMRIHGMRHRCHRQHVSGDVVWRCRWLPVDTSCRRARHRPPLRGPGSTQGHGRASTRSEKESFDSVPATDPVSREKIGRLSVVGQRGPAQGARVTSLGAGT